MNWIPIAAVVITFSLFILAVLYRPKATGSTLYGKTGNPFAIEYRYNDDGELEFFDVTNYQAGYTITWENSDLTIGSAQGSSRMDNSFDAYSYLDGWRNGDSTTPPKVFDDIMDMIHREQEL